ncbi:protein spaetzle 4 [Cloeon dipterum]|uniref:protein spaetzle 4 n=1 Tax=Cloeon dipterum TaxID=197152 RepID=UPI00321FD3FE
MPPTPTAALTVLLALLCGLSAAAFDEFSSACLRPGSGRASKAWKDPPCDFTDEQQWCTVPGSSYPWIALRSFVRENQGLMRRMYGEMRQISVLRAEFESNDLYPGDGTDFQVVRDGVMKRYRPVAEAAASTPRSTKPEVPNKESLTRKTVKPPRPTSTSTQATTTATKKTSTSTTTSTTTTTTTTTTTARTTTTAGTVPSTTRNATLTSAAFEAVEETTEGSTTLAPDTTSVSEEPVMEASEAEPLQAEDQQAEESEVAEEEAEGEDDEEYEEEEEGDADEDESDGDQSLNKGPQQILVRGVNACPVKEEVVAPFWANNTRGELLALLNLYPFEQYVHWEKCTDLNQQMFCRDGCRCEQQYRLHRLLAYDPRNECRGIFSDWFKFPSCCVCKCYDIPPEFRLTSRSPRRKSRPVDKGKKKATGLEPKLRTVVHVQQLDRRLEGGGELREDLKAVVHRSREPRLQPAESATLGTVDTATPHFYYQPPPVGLASLSRRPRDADD